MKRLKAVGSWLLRKNPPMNAAVINGTIGFVLIICGIAAFAEGSFVGMFGTFYGMLMWASAERHSKVIERFYDEMSRLCDEALASCKEATERTDRALKINEELISVMETATPRSGMVN